MLSRSRWSDPADILREKNTVSAVPLTITAKGFLPLGENARVYAGAGVGAYFAHAKAVGSWQEVGADLPSSATANETALGYHLVAGGEYKITRALGLDLQAKWFRAEPKFTFFKGSSDPISTGKLDIGGFLISLGLTFSL